MTAKDWRVDGLAGLAALTEADVPSVEIIYLDALAAYVMTGDALEVPYTVEHGAHVVAALLGAVTGAPAYRPDPTPGDTGSLTLARLAVHRGAQQFAARGRRGLDQLVSRVITAAVGELELQSESGEEQVRSLYRYGLMAVASGPTNLLGDAEAEGIAESFTAWDGLIGAGFVPPWRVPVAG